MKDGRLRKPVDRQLLHLPPDEGMSLAAAGQRPPPASDNLIAEARERSAVCRHRGIVEVAPDHLPQPFSLVRDRLMHAPSQLPLDGLPLRPRPVESGIPFEQEQATQSTAADEGEAEEVEGLRLAEPAPPAVLLCLASKLDQPRLPRMQ